MYKWHKPASRAGLADYCRRQLGAPVLEINVADEQVDDIIDDAIQFFQKEHFDGVSQAYLKYKITHDDIDRGNSDQFNGSNRNNHKQCYCWYCWHRCNNLSYYENSNFLQIPPSVIGVTKIYHFDGTNTMTNNMFSVKYQMFLNDIYYWGSYGDIDLCND